MNETQVIQVKYFKRTHLKKLNAFKVLFNWKKKLTVGHTRLAKSYGIVRLLFHIFNDYNIEMSVHINLKRAWLNNGVH